MLFRRAHVRETRKEGVGVAIIKRVKRGVIINYESIQKRFVNGYQTITRSEVKGV
jgi:hypothetical protein